ncbi:MAG: hypothetical protein NTU91_14900 [Chloroflexi bacterium]|nr:hypothetical protein [Chloroflexota bacterium]
MNQVKAAVKYALKAFFGGCFGCLGALSGTIVLLLVLAITLGPRAMGIVQGIHLPSIPSLLAPGTSPSGQGTPPMGTPGGSAPTDCYTTIDAWVSKSEMGQPETTFSQSDGIFPVVTNPTGCGAVNARLADSRGQTLLEKSYGVVGGGRNGYGNYNANKNLAPGSYEMQFWYGEMLLKKIQLTVQ